MIENIISSDDLKSEWSQTSGVHQALLLLIYIYISMIDKVGDT